jgi:hypothetical protein
MNTQRLEANSDAAWAAFGSQLHELDHFRFFGFHNLSRSQKKQLLNTLLKDSILYGDVKIELRFKLPVNDKQVADTIATLSSNNVLYDRVDLIGRDSPV